jgi:hypothetical protein
MSTWTRLVYDARLFSHPPQLSVMGANVMHSYFQVCHVSCLIGSESSVSMMIMIIYAATNVWSWPSLSS